jgi:SSS family solute:Na+ symporter
VKNRDSDYYLRAGRLVTIAGVLISVLTAFIAKGYSNIMNYIQTLFSIFNAPLFATFIIAMFWRRATPWGGFWSLVAGTAAAYGVNRLDAYNVVFHFGSALSASFWQAIIAFLVDGAVLVIVSAFTQPKPEERLRGLVWGLTRDPEPEVDADPRDKLWWRSPELLGGVALVILVVLNIIFI